MPSADPNHPETPLVQARTNSPTRDGGEEQKNKKDEEEKQKKKKKPTVRRYYPYAPLDHAARVYARLAMVLVLPVTITMLIITWAVQSLGPVDNTNPIKTQTAAAAPTSVDPAFVVVKESPDKSTGEKIGGALVNMLIVVGAITLITFIMVILYKYGYIKVLYVWLGITAALVFFFLAGLFLDLIATRYQVPYDYVTFSLIVWNFGVAGILSVFYMAHPIVSQGYLVVVSVIVTWGLTQTPEWTTWAILVGVAIYDILAVLCPNGPLHLLVKAAQERQEPIPGFVYDSDAGPAVELREQRPPPPPPAQQQQQQQQQQNNNVPSPAGKKDGQKNANNNDDDDDFLGSAAARPVNPMEALDKQQQQQQRTLVSGREAPTTTTSQEDIDALLGGGPVAATDSSSVKIPDYGSTIAAGGDGTAASTAWTASSPTRNGASAASDNTDDVVFTQQQASNADAESGKKKDKKKKKNDEDEEKKKKEKKKKEEEEEEEEEEDPFEAAHHATPFKLGLGDFIFYSLLVGRASMSVKSQTPWLVCYINIIGGMGATLASLLFLRGKVPALPALPFSIFAATIAFFVTRYVTTPYWDLLTLNAYTP